MQTPLRQVLVHDRDEAIVMMSFNEVHKLVNDEYSRHCTGFFASSRFSQMRRASTLQVPHLVFIFLMRQSAT